jgi:hypothetical protein
MTRTSKLLRRKDASKHLKEMWGVDRAPSTLAKLAVIGGGPPFQRLGRVPLYATDDLDEWIASKLSPPMHSTSQSATVGPGTSERGRKDKTVPSAGT